MNELPYEVTVTFRLNNILQYNGRSLETPDLTPQALSDTITWIDQDLRHHFRELEVFDEAFRPTMSRFLRPVILIARLALLDQQYNALTQQALVSGQRHITHASLLTEEACSYWNSIDKQAYQPQVHVLNGTDNASSGVWLGISEA